MPCFNNLLVINNSVLIENESSFIKLNFNDFNELYNYPKFPELLIMRLEPYNNFYTIIDYNRGEISNLANDHWLLQKDGSYYYKFTDYACQLHKQIYDLRATGQHTGIVHHLGHTFDNRLHTLRQLPTIQIHNEIHDYYEKCLKVKRLQEEYHIDSINELNRLLNTMTSPNYISYKDLPDPIKDSASIAFFGNRILQLKEEIR